jgi:hypothetical protein
MLRTALLVSGLLFACGVGPEFASVSAADGSSLGENGDTDVIRIRVGTSIAITAVCKQGDYPRGSSIVGTPYVTSDDVSVVSVVQTGTREFTLRGNEIGETLLRTSGECEAVYPLRVVSSP